MPHTAFKRPASAWQKPNVSQEAVREGTGMAVMLQSYRHPSPNPASRRNTTSPSQVAQPLDTSLPWMIILRLSLEQMPFLLYTFDQRTAAGQSSSLELAQRPPVADPYASPISGLLIFTYFGNFIQLSPRQQVGKSKKLWSSLVLEAYKTEDLHQIMTKYKSKYNCSFKFILKSSRNWW